MHKLLNKMILYYEQHKQSYKILADVLGKMKNGIITLCDFEI
jgi:hypothetical protein